MLDLFCASWYGMGERQVDGVAVRNMTRSALFAALMSLCAWLSLPVGQLAVSLQSFAVLLALGVLGGKRGTAAVAVYLALGAVGLPVFTGFRGGFSVLLGPTGGYLWGFLLAGGLFWLLEKRLRVWVNMILALLCCYACGTAWYAAMYGGDVWAVLGLCVAPYLLPDGCKLALALLCCRKLKMYT